MLCRDYLGPHRPSPAYSPIHPVASCLHRPRVPLRRVLCVPYVILLSVWAHDRMVQPADGEWREDAMPVVFVGRVATSRLVPPQVQQADLKLPNRLRQHD